MFTRIKSVRSGGRTYQYLQLLKSHREGDKVRQTVVASLGRVDELVESGQLQRIVESWARLCPQVQLLNAAREGTLQVERDRCWGPVLIFERIWKDLGLDQLLSSLAQRQSLQFNLERAAFAIVLQRLVAPGSDLAGSKWIHTMEGEEFDTLRLQHFYRTVGHLWKWKDTIERHLYDRDRDLFNQDLDLVFFDTTSTYFEGMRWKGWAELGFSRDKRFDHLQLVLGVVMRRDGVPITCEIWPGNTADAKTLQPIVEALRKRFQLDRVVIVCDRGMTSRANLKALEQAGYEYIVGMRMRSVNEVREQVLRRAGRYREVAHNLEVKEVWVDDRRYVVCRNPERVEKDRRDRENIIEALGKKRGSATNLVPNRGFRRFLKTNREAIEVDPQKVSDDARYDGKFVLRTNTDLPAIEVAEAYKNLTWIERLWRELKDVVEVRPVYHHHRKENVKGHIFASFLALYLSSELRKKLAAIHPTAGGGDTSPPLTTVPWNDLMRDISQVRAVRVRLGDATYLMRTELQGCAHLAFRAVGVRPPPLAALLPREAAAD